MLRIRVLRMSQGMTLWALSEASNICQGRLSMVERGIVPATDDERERLAKILQAPPGTLFRPACRSRQGATPISVCGV